ncbi:MAG: RecX family transcriptional regulator [Acholeplasmatales bacterium]|nr:RecX family transcriptional regulator [Acholeplasmatales bacterium]
MIVKSLKKSKKKDLYNVVIDEMSLELSENIIVKYRIVKGKEVDKAILKDIIKDNNLDALYSKTMAYAIRYNKGSAEIRKYLEKKETSDFEIELIIKRLIESKIISDLDVVEGLVSSYVRNGNGILLIKEKLYQKGYSKELTDLALENINYDMYYQKMNNQYTKALKAQKKGDEFERMMKAKNAMLRRGYTYSDLEKLN